MRVVYPYCRDCGKGNRKVAENTKNMWSVCNHPLAWGPKKRSNYPKADICPTCKGQKSKQADLCLMCWHKKVRENPELQPACAVNKARYDKEFIAKLRKSISDASEEMGVDSSQWKD